MVTEASPITKYGKVTQRHLLGDIDCLSLVSFTVICTCNAIIRKLSLKQEGSPSFKEVYTIMFIKFLQLEQKTHKYSNTFAWSESSLWWSKNVFQRYVQPFSSLIRFPFNLNVMKATYHLNDYPISSNWSFSIPPKNIRTPEVFWCFQGVLKETSGMEWIKLICSLHFVFRVFGIVTLILKPAKS